MGLPHNGRRVKIDYSQSALPHDRGRGRQNLNDGTRDIGNAPSAVLLFRGLDPLSGPQAIAQAMMGSAGPSKEGHKGMKRIILIKDKVTLASFQFTFVEFVDIQVFNMDVQRPTDLCMCSRLPPRCWQIPCPLQSIHQAFGFQTSPLLRRLHIHTRSSPFPM